MRVLADVFLIFSEPGRVRERESSAKNAPCASRVQSGLRCKAGRGREGGREGRTEREKEIHTRIRTHVRMSHAPHTHAHTHTRTRRCTFLSCEMERLAWLKKSSPDAAALTSRCAASSTHRPHRAMLARAAGSAASRGGGSCVNTAHGHGRRLRDGSLNTGAERNLQKAVQSVPALGESAKDARGTLVTPPCRACALHLPFHAAAKDRVTQQQHLFVGPQNTFLLESSVLRTGSRQNAFFTGLARGPAPGLYGPGRHR